MLTQGGPPLSRIYQSQLVEPMEGPEPLTLDGLKVITSGRIYFGAGGAWEMMNIFYAAFKPLESLHVAHLPSTIESPQITLP